MRHTEIAIIKPFEGAPKINMADIFGASPEKPIILKIPVSGERPITYGAKNLPEGLTLENGIITGKVAKEGNYTVTLTAKNALGEDEKELVIEINKDQVLLTPLMGFTSWNAFGADVTQEKMLGIAKKMTELGICEYGYSYINTDSGWQREYGGKYDAIVPNVKFPDMKAMCDEIHSYGLKAGIYSTPMLVAWGCPNEYLFYPFIPGCTTGEPDIRFSDINFGIGVERKEKNNALQWAEWGFDYLKYDWRPTDPYNAELMRKELVATDRDFGFCVTVNAMPEYHKYWEQYTNSYRNNTDAHGRWDNLLTIYRSYLDYGDFTNYVKKGHFLDLDMLDVGSCTLDEEAVMFQFNEDEQLVAYSLRAFFSSPIQISSQLIDVDDFELSMYCNNEIIAINQDTAFCSAKPILTIEKGDTIIHGYKRLLSNGDFAIALFNLGETKEFVTTYLDEEMNIRDVWAKKDLEKANKISLAMEPHTVRIFRMSK